MCSPSQPSASRSCWRGRWAARKMRGLCRCRACLSAGRLQQSSRRSMRCTRRTGSGPATDAGWRLPTCGGSSSSPWAAAAGGRRERAMSRPGTTRLAGCLWLLAVERMRRRSSGQGTTAATQGPQVLHQHQGMPWRVRDGGTLHQELTQLAAMRPMSADSRCCGSLRSGSRAVGLAAGGMLPLLLRLLGPPQTLQQLWVPALMAKTLLMLPARCGAGSSPQLRSMGHWQGPTPAAGRPALPAQARPSLLLQRQHTSSTTTSCSSSSSTT
ncbi:hypothetical protein COO60DRAFT_1500510 [Scenedesmus sp. NREL 46B-D3]|nr:hypothetical protein COO60DRAFT_1500510 [Scenedesmus sp. NREL 46B-D3]